MAKPALSDTMIARNPLPSPNSACPSDSENEIANQLEQRRRQVEEEIQHFRTRKELEFRDFENTLRSNRKRKKRVSSNGKIGGEHSGQNGKPKRTSSSSALDLLIGHGVPQSTPKDGYTLKTGHGTFHKKRDSLSTKTLPSTPTLSIDPLNVKGETCPQANQPSMPTVLSRNLPPSPSRSTTVSPKSEKSEKSEKPLDLKSSLPPTPVKEASESFVGVFHPTYLPLLDANSKSRISSMSPLITPPADDASSVVARDFVNTRLPNGVLPLQSSSFPPHVAIISPTSYSSKRAYTAPATANRKPSALRSASATNLARKRKHVTFRLADSAIVDPSSSYEEGPSPQFEEQGKAPRSKSTTAVSHASKKSSSLRHSNVGTRNGLIGDHTRSDEEDEAAGVKPGMSMGEVMQKLNQFSLANDVDDNTNLQLEDEEDVGWTDTKYHEQDLDEDDEDEDNDEVHAESSQRDHQSQTDMPTGGDDDSGSYFTYKHHRGSSQPLKQTLPEAVPSRHRDRSGSSPLTPIRDQDWNNLSSSDKDRLLFSRRASDENDSDQAFQSSSTRVQPESATVPSGPSGLKKTSSHNSLTTLNASRKANDRNPKAKVLQPRQLQVPRLEDDLKPSADGGSGVGFFELDEELASPNAGKVNPFTNEADLELEGGGEGDALGETDDKNTTLEGLNSVRSSFLPPGAASVPIDIVRPSASVSSSWVGTFGH